MKKEENQNVMHTIHLEEMNTKELKNTRAGFFGPIIDIIVEIAGGSGEDPCYCDRTWNNGVSR